MYPHRVRGASERRMARVRAASSQPLTARRSRQAWFEFPIGGLGLGGKVMKKSDERELLLLKREPELAPTPAPTSPMDAAESRWDPWLIALARIEAEEAAPPPN